jgi:hypothetical protein
VELRITPSAQQAIDSERDKAKRKKIEKCLAKLEINPDQPSLHSHHYDSFDKVYGQKVWESYVEEGTPGAWRVWWFYGPEPGQLSIVAIGKHP